MRENVLRLLNIRPHESELAKRLFLVQFFLVIGSAFLFISSYAIFLSHYHIIELPKAYLLSGIFLLVFNLLYAKTEHILSTRQLLYSVIIFCAVVTLLMWIGMRYTSWALMPYLLFIWNNLVYMFTSLVFWGLAAVLFDVRESKRLFTIIGSGDIPAKFIGYLTVSLLAPYIGLDNMILISIISFLGSGFFVYYLFHSANPALRRLHHREVKKDGGKPDLKRIFGSGLIVSISWLSLITFIVLILVEFVFLAEVKTRYHTDIELAYFFGIFFASGRVLAVILKICLSSRMINSLGIERSLLLSPVILLVTVFFIIFASAVNIRLRDFLYIFGILSLLTEILKSIIQEPIFLVLFQPLKVNLRLRGHVIAKGYMYAIAFILSGGLLVGYIEKVKHPSMVLFSYILAGIIIAWIAVIFIVKKEYLKTLHDALKSGFFRGNELFLKDDRTIYMLVRRSFSHKSAEAMHALDLLERSDYGNTDQLLCRQLKRKDPVMAGYALRRLIVRRYESALPDIEKLLDKTAGGEMAGLCIEAIGEMHKNAGEKLEAYIDAEDEYCRRAAITGLLKSGDLNAIVLAGRQLLMLIQSDQENERRLAAAIIGATGVKNFYRTLLDLLDDESLQVQKEAISAAGRIKSENLIPALIGKLNQKQLAKAATRALADYGDDILDYYTVHAADYPGKETLFPFFVPVAGRINSARSSAFLVRNLFDYPRYRKQVTGILWEKEYEADADTERQLRLLLEAELAHAVMTTRYYRETSHYPGAGRLCRALLTEINGDMENIFRLLSFFNDRHKINSAMSAVFNLKENFKSSNAFEMLEMVLPKEIFQPLKRLLDFIRHPDDGRKIHGEQKETFGEVLKNIIKGEKKLFNEWTRAVAISMIGDLKDRELVGFLKKMEMENEPPIIKETGFYVISGIN